MFDIATQLFEGQDIRFGPIDYEKDPEIESKWTHNAEFMRLYEFDPARPMSAAVVKKEYEKFAREMQEIRDRTPPVHFIQPEENDLYSDEYKDFLKHRHIDGIFIYR